MPIGTIFVISGTLKERAQYGTRIIRAGIAGFQVTVVAMVFWLWVITTMTPITDTGSC